MNKTASDRTRSDMERSVLKDMKCRSTKPFDILYFGTSIMKRLRQSEDAWKILAQGRGVFNLGIPGAKAIEVENLILKVMSKHKAKILVVHCGSNDASSCLSYRDIVASIFNSCVIATFTNPRIKILISQILPRKTPELNPFLKQDENCVINNVNKDLKDICSKLPNISFIEHTKITTGSEYFLRDGIHLNDDGNIVLAESLWLGIQSCDSDEENYFEGFNVHDAIEATKRMFIDRKHLLYCTNQCFFFAASIHFKKACQLDFDSSALDHCNMVIKYLATVCNKMERPVACDMLKGTSNNKVPFTRGTLPSFIENLVFPLLEWYKPTDGNAEYMSRCLFPNLEKSSSSSSNNKKPPHCINVSEMAHHTGDKSLTYAQWKLKPNSLYIGRKNDFINEKKSDWHNPFKFKKNEEYKRKESIVKYEKYVRQDPKLMNSLMELEGKEMGCWCKPAPCHGDILIKLFMEQLTMSESHNPTDGTNVAKIEGILPCHLMQESIMKFIAENNISLISGETGCGKSTVIPQILLNKYPKSNIIVLQPRRLSAVSLAEFVAQQLNENSVGYVVRFRKKMPSKAGCIIYSTYGTFLRSMLADPGLANVSYLILDEVHERQEWMDFLFIFIKRNLDKLRDLKVIIMSATMDFQGLENYFQCESLKIPGQCHPITTNHKDIDRSKDLIPTNHKDIDRSKDLIPIDEIFQQVKYIDESIGGTGAILVFLPGWKEMCLLQDMIVGDEVLSNKCSIFMLHSKYSKVESNKVFDEVENGKRKIVISTNICESSVTITDVEYVINSGYTKIEGYSRKYKMKEVITKRSSTNSNKQRAGRAGRLKPGVCYNMFSEDIKIDKSEEPALTRSSLIRLSLQIKLLNLGTIKSFLQDAVQPPQSEFVTNAVSHLFEMKALDGEENITRFGVYLAHMPLEPSNAIMLLYGCLFSCLYPLLIIACFDEADVFVYPPRKEKIHEHYELYELYQKYSERAEVGTADEFCNAQFLSIESMSNIDLMVKKLMKILHSLGIVFSEVADHPFHNSHCGNKTLIGALIYASHSNHLFQLLEGESDQVRLLRNCDIVEIGIGKYLRDKLKKGRGKLKINHYCVFTTGVIINGKLRISSYTKLSAFQMLFFQRQQPEDVYNDICSKLKINDQQLRSKLNQIRSTFENILTDKEREPSSQIIPVSSLYSAIEEVEKLFYQGN